MKTLFSTEAVHPRDRFYYWHEVACRTIVDHDSRPQRRRGFDARIEAGTLDDIGLVRFNNSAMTIAHTAHHVARAQTDEFFLCRQMAGTLELEQDGREVALKVGDMTLLDPMLPYSGRFSSGSNLFVLKLSRRALEARVGKIRRMVAVGMKALDADTRLTSSFLATLLTHSGKISKSAERSLRDPVLDLVALSLATTMRGCLPRVSSARALVSVTVRAAIESSLSNPALDPNTVAAAAHVSVRYANAVLAQEGTSIARLILKRRLARCERALKDPQQARRSVSEIAYDWGFSDMTHFGRAFRNAYGMLPSAYRRENGCRDSASPGEL
jgi:AraC family transcriptional activator of tynA and feaB